MEVWETNIGNAYLESKILQKVYIIAGTEFGYREVRILIFAKELYGLLSSGLWWN